MTTPPADARQGGDPQFGPAYWDALGEGDPAGDIFDGAEIIHAYTREQAIADGQLVDVSGHAKELGFTYPVALTVGAWADCVAWDKAATRKTGSLQDEAGRLHDVLWMTYLSVLRARHASRVRVQLVRVPRDGRYGAGPELVTLEAVCGPGDLAEPVITIQQPGED